MSGGLISNIGRFSTWLPAIIWSVAGIGCGGTLTPNHTPTPHREAIPAVQPEQENQSRFGYTHQRPDGNRWVPGIAALPEVSPFDIPLKGTPRWVVAAPVNNHSKWIVVLDDGRVQVFTVEDGQVSEEDISLGPLPPGMPPLLRTIGSQTELITAIDPLASPLSPPAILQPSGRTAFIRSNGDVVVSRDMDITGDVAVQDGTRLTILELDALPDGRILTDGQDRLLVLSGATSRYGHGVLGDTTEAAGITLVDAGSTVAVRATIELKDTEVVEGLAPIWADLNNDGVREIVVTVSNANQGARIVVFNQEGDQTAAGPAIGLGSRWRHQLAVAPFGPGGEVELADVLTPHIGGVVEFYRLENHELRIVARLPGYSSHILGSRNLDMALAGDLDGDGAVELLVPDQQMANLAGIRRTSKGAEEVWTIPIGGRASTNIASVTFSNGTMSVGIGRQDNTLRIWPSPPGRDLLTGP